MLVIRELGSENGDWNEKKLDWKQKISWPKKVWWHKRMTMRQMKPSQLMGRNWISIILTWW